MIFTIPHTVAGGLIGLIDRMAVFVPALVKQTISGILDKGAANPILNQLNLIWGRVKSNRTNVISSEVNSRIRHQWQQKRPVTAAIVS